MTPIERPSKMKKDFRLAEALKVGKESKESKHKRYLEDIKKGTVGKSEFNFDKKENNKHQKALNEIKARATKK